MGLLSKGSSGLEEEKDLDHQEFRSTVSGNNEGNTEEHEDFGVGRADIGEEEGDKEVYQDSHEKCGCDNRKGDVMWDRALLK